MSSTYTPFFRRFTDEKGRELEETRQLYAWVKARQDAFEETPESVGKRVYQYLKDLPDEIERPFLYALHDLMVAETRIWDLPEPNLERRSMQEYVEYRNLLYAKQHFFANRDDILESFHQGLVRLLCGIANDLPETENHSPFTIPLIYTIDEPRLAIERIFGTLTDGDYEEKGLFLDLSRQLYQNICRVSGIESPDSKKPWRYPRDSTFPLEQLVDEYLAGTPFQELFKVPVPLKLTHADRFGHMHIVGGTNAGKTSLIETLLLHDIASDDPPSLVVIEPHSDLIRKLARADLGIEDRLIIIDPRDIEHPPALNIFALNQERMNAYDEVMREQIVAGVIETYEYLFSGLGIELTGKQQVLFRNVCRLLIALPQTLGRNATVLDMIKIMAEPPKGPRSGLVPEEYQEAVAALPDIPREFFENDFHTQTFKQTKEQIRYRLQALIENPVMGRLLSSPETKVDIFDALNSGKIILVDTAKDFLKGASADYGKLFISLVQQAILERSAIAAHERKPTFVFIDEAGSYFSSNIDELLSEARKYKVGLVLSHQFMDQASYQLRASLAANTGIKFVSGLSASDARYFSADMRTTPEFIMNQPQLQFAAHIRNVTPHAVSIPIVPGALDRQPKLSDEAFEALMATNRRRVSLPRVEAPRPGSSDAEAGQPVHRQEHPAVRRPPDEDVSREW